MQLPSLHGAVHEGVHPRARASSSVRRRPDTTITVSAPQTRPHTSKRAASELFRD